MVRKQSPYNREEYMSRSDNGLAIRHHFNKQVETEKHNQLIDMGCLYSYKNRTYTPPDWKTFYQVLCILHEEAAQPLLNIVHEGKAKTTPPPTPKPREEVVESVPPPTPEPTKSTKTSPWLRMVD